MILVVNQSVMEIFHTLLVNVAISALLQNKQDMVGWAKRAGFHFCWARLVIFCNDWKLHQNLACPTILRTYNGLAQPTI